MNRLADARDLAPSARSLDARSLRARADQECAGGARRRDGADGLPHRALVRGQGGARLLDRALPRRRPADRARDVPAVPSGRHAVRGEGGACAPTPGASGRATSSSPTIRTTAARTCPTSCWSSRSFVDGALIGFSVRARPHDRHRRAHPRRQCERLHRDLPGGLAHSALAPVARRRARRDDVPPDRAQRARARTRCSATSARWSRRASSASAR